MCVRVCAEYGCAAGAKGAAGDVARAAPDVLTYIGGADSKAAGLSPAERRAALAAGLAGLSFRACGCAASRRPMLLAYRRRGCRAALAGVGGLRHCQGARVSPSRADPSWARGASPRIVPLPSELGQFGP